MPGSKKYVCFSGIIGAGKTELINRLCELGNGRFCVAPEPCLGGFGPANNWLLEDFYKDMPKHSFAMQMLMLHKRVGCVLQAREEPAEIVLMDRCFQEDSVFADALHQMGNMCLEHRLVCEDAHDTMEALVGVPDLIIFLDVSPEVAMRRCAKRGRECESKLAIDYFSDLAVRERAWANAMSIKTKVVVWDWNLDNPDLNVVCSAVEKIIELLE